ncbi:MAG: mRNA splicing protein prp18 [Piccolia ochrophora]|nr:MAG: mRNA splicing protein prp18 [Piccolia ochrophora]
MDFASLMSKEISKAKPSDTSTNKTSYVKRADLEKQREAAYEADQARLRAERDAKAAKKRKWEDEETQRNRDREEKRRRLAEESRIRREEEDAARERARRKRLGLPDVPVAKAETPLPEGEEDVADDELVSKLRDMQEPARLFGESHKQRLRRFRRLTAPKQPPGGLTSLEPVPAEQMLVDKVPADVEGKKFLFRQLASYFAMVLKEWERALVGRTEAVKESFQGKAAYNAMVQSRESMEPLFRKFEKGELEILEPVVEIVKAAQERRYVDANDGYLRLSIGKAAWPIGVTMVGIHERSAREKLHESEAHIMSDEVTRKFLQSIKRCLSFAQTRWPPFEQGQLMG